MIIFVAIYLLSYVEVRRSHLLVHTSSFSGEEDGDKITYSHGVSHTDVIGLLEPRLFSTVVFVQLIYSPLIVSEVMYWYLIEPRGGIWQYKIEDTYQTA